MFSCMADVDPQVLMSTSQTILMQFLDLTQDLQLFLS